MTRCKDDSERRDRAGADSICAANATKMERRCQRDRTSVTHRVGGWWGGWLVGGLFSESQSCPSLVLHTRPSASSPPYSTCVLNMKYGGGGGSAFVVLHVSLCTCLSVCIIGGWGGSSLWWMSVCLSTNRGLGPNRQMSPQGAWRVGGRDGIWVLRLGRMAISLHPSVYCEEILQFFSCVHSLQRVAHLNPVRR